MIRKQTIGLWLIALLLCAMVWWLEGPRHHPDQNELSQSTVLPASMAGRWNHLIIKQASEQWVFGHDSGEWELKQPVEDLAHPTRIQSLIDTFSGLKRETILSAETIKEQGGWQAFGLESPSLSLRFGNEDQESLVEVGQRESIGNKVYLRLNGESEAWVVSADWLDRMQTDFNAWREPRILPVASGTVQRLEWLQAEGLVVLERAQKGDAWQLVAPPELAGVRANQIRLETLLEKVLPNWEAVSFVSEEASQDRLLLGLEDPVMQFTLKQGEQVIDSVSFGFPDPDNPALRFVASQRRQSVMRMREDLFEQQFNLPITAFRDPFLIEPGYACNQISVGGEPGFTLSYLPESLAWSLTQPENMPTDQELVGQMHQQLVNLQIMAYHDALPANQVEALFQQPAFQCNLATSQGENTLRSLDLTFSQPVGASILVRRSDEATLYELPASILRSLPNHAVQLRRRLLWEVPETDLSQVAVVSDHASRSLQRSVESGWGMEGMPLKSEYLSDWSTFLTVLANPPVTEWVEHGDERYASFGLDQASKPLSLHVQFQREQVSADRKLLIGRRSPDGSDFYVGTDVETGPVVCKLSAQFVEILRQVLSWEL